MVNELTMPIVKTLVGTQQALLINEQVVDEVNKLAKDPQYGEEFIQSYLDHLAVLKKNTRYTPTRYLNALKFFSLVEGGDPLIEAYIKVFPDRYTQRTNREPNQAAKKAMMTSEASRYNRTQLVNDIRYAATIPVQLIHRHLLHDAILETANLMTNAKSELVRQKAAATLIQELKPAEDNTINIRVEDGTGSVIEDLRKATERLALKEHQAVLLGTKTLEEVSATKIIEGESEIVDVTPEPVLEEEEAPVDDQEPKKWTLTKD